MSEPRPNPTSHTPRKRFGQNFLDDPHYISLIVDAIAPRSSDTFIEIGAGKGALTYPLLEQDADVHAIEIDRDLAQALEQYVSASNKLRVHCADALHTNLVALIKNPPVRIVGNLPYNISTPLLFHLATFQKEITDMYLMLQREVMERLCAKVGSKNYGRLSVMTAHCFEVYPLFDVPPQAFDPKPKVVSSFTRFVPKQNFSLETHRELDRIVKLAFSNRRKTVANAMATLLGSEELQELGIDPKQRASSLDITQFLCVLEYINSQPRR